MWYDRRPDCHAQSTSVGVLLAVGSKSRSILLFAALASNRDTRTKACRGPALIGQRVLANAGAAGAVAILAVEDRICPVMSGLLNR